MKQSSDDYEVVPYPKMRRWMAVTFRSAQHKPMIHGLIEVDVTRVRAFLREYKVKTGESLSFTAFIVACLGKAVDGAPATRFVTRLKDLIESGYGLDDSMIELEQTIAPGASRKISSGSY